MRDAMTNTGRAFDSLAWAPSVYYVESLVSCGLRKAWDLMLDYRAWNPSFADAEVTRVGGEPNTVGEIVLIKKSLLDVTGEPLPEFYAETVKLVPLNHIVWYVYPKAGDSFRNFVDFGLAASPGGVRFYIDYYAQNPLSGELLAKERQQSESGLRDLTQAFKNHCESRM